MQPLEVRTSYFPAGESERFLSREDKVKKAISCGAPLSATYHVQISVAQGKSKPSSHEGFASEKSRRMLQEKRWAWRGWERSIVLVEENNNVKRAMDGGCSDSLARPANPAKPTN